MAKKTKVKTPMADVTFRWYEGAEKKFEDTQDMIVYYTARLTLDKSYQMVPLSNQKNSGRLRTSTMDYGVQGSNKDYTIGSTTSYAKFVYKMGPKTNWTTPGTNSKWFERTWKSIGKNLLSISVKNDGLKK